MHSYSNKIVCFFDLLGFGSKVSNKEISFTELKNVFNDFNDIINDYKDKSNELVISQFSDSFVISIKILTQTVNQLRFIRDIVQKALEYKFLIRGAMVYGEVFHEEKNIFGPAMCLGADLEKCEAKYPRIIIHNSVLNLEVPSFPQKTTYLNWFNDFYHVKTDDDHNRYFDYFDESNTPHINEILKDLKRKISMCDNEKTKEKLNEKYAWLINKLGSK